MKKTILFLLFFVAFFGFSAYAQNEFDKVVLLTGEEIQCKIVKNYDDKIEFCYPNEEMITVLTKDKISKMVFRSGREEIIRLKPHLYDEEKYGLLKHERTKGDFSVIRNDKDKSKINISIVFSETVIDKCGQDVINNIYGDAVNSYISGRNQIFKDGMSIARRLTTEETDRFKAILYIVDVDTNDGEVYGYIEYFDLKSDNPDEPVFSAYKNGNGERLAKKLSDRMLGGIRHCGWTIDGSTDMH